MKYVITGGAGFIGSNIAHKLVEMGEEVVVIDNLFSGKEKNLEDIKTKIRFVKGDITDGELLKKEFSGADFVLHQAAVASVPRSINDPEFSNKNNVSGTLRVLIAARDAKVKRVVYAGSSSVYGDSETLPKTEEMAPNPLSPYALQKLTGEIYCRLFSDLYGLDTVTLRYFNVFGPRQDPHSEYAAVIPLFIRKMLSDESPHIFGDGMQSRDFNYIDNVVEANILACKAKGPLKGQAINIACGERIELLGLVRSLNKLLDKDISPMLKEPRAGDIRHSLAGISRAKTLLGFKPRILFQEGLKKTLEWYKDGN